jgi:hypothetical protein
MSRCEFFKKPNDTYIYMSQPVWQSLDQFCSLLVCILQSYALLWTLEGQGFLVLPQWPPLAPSTPPTSPSFLRQHIPAGHLSCLTNMVPDTARLVYDSKRSWEAWISISAYETNRNCWPESFQSRTVTHIVRQKSHTKIGDIHKNWCLLIQ